MQVANATLSDPTILLDNVLEEPLHSHSTDSFEGSVRERFQAAAAVAPRFLLLDFRSGCLQAVLWLVFAPPMFFPLYNSSNRAPSDLGSLAGVSVAGPLMTNIVSEAGCTGYRLIDWLVWQFNRDDGIDWAAAPVACPAVSELILSI